MKENTFNKLEIQHIKQRFNQISIKNSGINYHKFQKIIGLLGLGQCQFISKRLFDLISSKAQWFQFQQFLSFLQIMVYGNIIKRANLSFKFIDYEQKGKISFQDLQLIISQLCISWNFLTGQKINPGLIIQLISNKIGIGQNKTINLNQYIQKYQGFLPWFQYLNTPIHKQKKTQEQFQIEQIQQYLKFLHTQVTNMMLDLKQPNQLGHNQLSNLGGDLSIIKGPLHVSSQSFKLRGDVKDKDKSQIIKAEQLSNKLEDQGHTKIQIIKNKLQQISLITSQLLPQYLDHQEEEKVYRMTLIQTKQLNREKRSVVYPGHLQWNIMLNIMLGLRKALKSHFYLHKDHLAFTIEDLGSKYPHDLLYKKNSQSTKQVCQIFIDYAPKVFSYIRKLFQIDTGLILQSIGLQNLLGNLLMGYLSTFYCDENQFNEEKFKYYTDDSRLVIQSITRQQSHLMRFILDKYVRYIKRYPQTFLPRIYGLYKLKNKNTNRQIYFIIYDNIFAISTIIKIKYHIKPNSKSISTGNFLNEKDFVNQSKSININQNIKKKIYQQLTLDFQLLCQLNIIEYQLHIGVGQFNTNINGMQKQPHIIKNSNGNQVYLFGIVNILEQYSTSGIIGNTFKNIFSDNSQYLDARQYRDKFLTFLGQHLF